MLRKFLIVFGITILIFLVLFWIYFPSISRYRELKLEEEKINKRIQEIDTQIKSLTEERKLLQTDVVYLEKVIREELGFVKPGEIVYELVTRPVSKDSKVPPENSRDMNSADSSTEKIQRSPNTEAFVSAQKS